MRIIKPSASLMVQPTTPIEAMRHIERCGRVCYKSEGKITPDTYKGFIERIIKRGHEAVLEHGRLIVKFEDDMLSWFDILEVIREQRVGTPLYLAHTHGASGNIVSGNFRAWRDALRLCIQYGCRVSQGLCDILSEYDVLFSDLLPAVQTRNESAKRLSEVDLKDRHEIQAHVCRSIRFVCDRGVSHEIVRHRPASYCQESTRYCNYSKDDFGGEITVIKPCFLSEYTLPYAIWKDACEHAEHAYFALLTEGDCTPQQARAVLPNSLKTEVVMTATVAEWLHFLRLRCSEAAHPQMREVATRVKDELLRDLPRMEAWL